MNQHRQLTVFILFLTAVIPLILITQISKAAPTATTYYICDCDTNADGDCVAGDDNNAGTNPAAAWQSAEKARTTFNSTLTAGDEIRFCQGGAFDLGTSARWSTPSCTAAAPCVVADYTPSWASGNEQRPILWKTSSGHAFDLADGGDANYEEGYTFQNLDLRCTACTDGDWAFFLFNDINDVLIDNVSMDSFDIGVHMAGANPCAAGEPQCNRINDRITIRNVNIINSLGQGILGGGDDILIENSYFENNGTTATFDHNIYLSSGTRVTVRNNELYRSTLDSDGNCSAVSLVGHGHMTDLLIEGNYLHEDVGKANDNCWGIAITPAYGSAESFTNVTIRGNRVENMGNMSIGTASCMTCTIENNVIIQNQGFGTRGIMIPAQLPQAGDAISADITVRNNSIWTNTGAGIEINEGSGHIIVSNAIQAISSDTGWNCIDATMAAGNYDVINHNICDFGAGEWANGVGNLAAWQGQGWGVNSIAAAPGFSSGTNLSPSDGAVAMVDAGHLTLSAAIDFDGNGRDATPDMGAYEWQTGAIFHQLTVNRGGSGDGIVSSSPSGIDCGVDCSEAYVAGAMVTLTAVSSSTSTFTGWTGAGCTGTGNCVVTMNTAETVTAVFDANLFSLFLPLITQ